MSVVAIDRPSDLFVRLTPQATRRIERGRSGRHLSAGLIIAGDLAALAVAVALARPTRFEAICYVVPLALLLAMRAVSPPRVNLSALGEAPAHAVAVGGTLLTVAFGEALLLRLFGIGDGVSSEAVLMIGVAALLIPVGRWVTYTAIRVLRQRRIVRDPAVVVGAGDVGRRVAAALERDAHLGLEPVGFVDDIDPAGAPAPLLGDLQSLDEVISRHSVRRVIVAHATSTEETLVRLLRPALRRQVDVHVVPNLHPMARDAGVGPTDAIECIPLQRLRPAAPTLREWPAKRIFDVVVAGAALVLLAPLLLMLAIGVKLGSPGPVLFRQCRVGQHGRTFELLKFRTLRVNDDSDVRWSVAGDERQTRFGAWMRRFSLDELPQLWSVVRGDMSLIGPRPERPHFVAQFSDSVDGYADRHRVPVGLTGWAQINGLRGDTSIADRARFDNYYIDHWSMLRDLSIIAATVTAVLRDGRRRRSA